jgi:hypothetical protein
MILALRGNISALVQPIITQIEQGGKRQTGGRRWSRRQNSAQEFAGPHTVEPPLKRQLSECCVLRCIYDLAHLPRQDIGGEGFLQEGNIRFQHAVVNDSVSGVA